MNDSVLVTAYVIENELRPAGFCAQVYPGPAAVFFDETEARSYLALVDDPHLYLSRVPLEVRRGGDGDVLR